MRHYIAASVLIFCLATGRTPQATGYEPKVAKEPVKDSAEHPEPQLVRGTKVKLVRPEGFTDAKRFPGFQQDESGASVVVMEVPGPFKKVTAAFTAAGLKQGGMKLKARTDIKVGGLPGVLVEAEQVAQGIEFRKWIVAFGDDARTVMITANFPATAPEELSTILHDCVLTAKWDRDRPVDPLADVGFSITPPPSLKLDDQIIAGKMLMFSKEGKAGPNSNPDDPFFIAGQSLGNVEIKDRKQFATDRFLKTAQTKDIEVDATTPVKIDNLLGYEIVGKASDAKTGKPLCVYQVILFEPDGKQYIIMQGMVGEAHCESSLKDFKASARTFKRKDG